MNEGWAGDQYFTFFDEADRDDLAAQYDLSAYLPGFHLIGLVGWDSFLLSKADRFYLCPTVPLDSDYLENYPVNCVQSTLEADRRHEGKVKWYTKPLLFGGDPKDQDNVTWVSYAKHPELVRWWNGLYRKHKS